MIVDDEPIAVEGLKRQLKGLDFLNLSATFHNPIEASSYLEVNNIDLLFLDINMPHLNGMRMLRSLSKKPLVIFTTAHPDYALEAFGFDAVDYLLKPFTFENLVKAINKALLMLTGKIHRKDQESSFIRSEGKYHRLDLDEILFVEGMKDYVKIKLNKDVLTAAMNLTGIMEQLPADKFLRIHKSYIVNKKQVSSFDSNELMVGEVTLPIGNIYRDAIMKEMLANHVIKR